MQNITQFLFHDLLWSLEILLKNILGTFTHPYLTWKHISREKYILPSLLMLIISLLVFSLRAPLKEGLPDSAYTAIATIFINLTTSILGFSLISITIYILARKFQSTASFITLSSTWSYTYIPTIIWFLATQSAYLIIPPPRSASIPGILFTILYLAFSISLLTWKILLLWLTFQVTAQLKPLLAIISTIITTIVVIVYSYFLFRTHLWGIPFL